MYHRFYHSYKSQKGVKQGSWVFLNAGYPIQSMTFYTSFRKIDTSV